MVRGLKHTLCTYMVVKYCLPIIKWSEHSNILRSSLCSTAAAGESPQTEETLYVLIIKIEQSTELHGVRLAELR